MNVLKNKMQRRDFLRSLASAGLTTTFASQFMLSSNVFAQTGGAKRFVMVFYPNGCVPDKWHSYNLGALGGDSFAASPLKELTRHIDKVVPFKNITFSGHGGSEAHPDAAKGVFSGGVSGGKTFDYAIGEALGGRLTNNLHVGVWSSRTGQEYNPFHSGAGDRKTVPDNPQQVYDSVLADLVGNGGGNTPDPETARRKRVLESLHENLDLLQANSLNVKQQGKLLTHEEALNYYQDVLSNSLDIGSGFSRPIIGMTGENNAHDADLIAKEQMRNIAMAFQADVTRTASFQFMGAQDDNLFVNFDSIVPYLGEYGLSKRFHNELKSHASSHSGSLVFNAQTYWYNNIVAYLMDELAARPDLAYGGTLLDNTLILVMSEMAQGSHAMQNAGIYVAGGAGGAIFGGKAIDTNGAGMSNLYLSIAKAFGLNWSRYGNSNGLVNGFLR